MIKELVTIFDFWEIVLKNKKTHSYFSLFLLILFILFLSVIQLNKYLPVSETIHVDLPKNNLYAIEAVLYILLIKEMVEMIYSLTQSITIAQRKQLEILSLILIRSTFKELSDFGDPITWNFNFEHLMHILGNGFAAIIIFFIIARYYQIETYQSLYEKKEIKKFVMEKKIVALVLFFIFFVIIISDIITFIKNQTYSPSFEKFFTMFIFADIAIVILSLAYSHLYYAVFRNSGFALVTVLILLSLIAPHIYREFLAVLSALLAYLITYTYNKYIPLIMKSRQKGEFSKEKIF